jgi:signal recognition particle subunit SRP54
MQKNRFDFNDFLDQMKMMKKMGSMSDLLGMIPGMGAKMKNMPVDDRKMAQVEAIVLSMTPKERAHPQIIKGTRRKRIAMGSGTSVMQVNQLLKQFSMMRKMMRSKGKMKQMMSQFGGGGPGGGGGGPFG